MTGKYLDQIRCLFERWELVDENLTADVVFVSVQLINVAYTVWEIRIHIY